MHEHEKLKIITFGEVMLRLNPPGFLRFSQARSLEVTFGGAEANVAVFLSLLGIETEYVTRLPENDFGDACLQNLRQYGVGTSWVLRGGDRLGIYFYEIGSMHRPSNIIYDRANSSVSSLAPGMVDWRKVFEGADWFHWTGITPALSESLAAVNREAVKTASDMGLTVSCDLNYRFKLWKWGKQPHEIMPDLFRYCSVAVVSEDHLAVMLGIRIPGSGEDIPEGTDRNREMCEQLREHYPGLETIAFTVRGSSSAGRNTLFGGLWHGGTLYTSPTYDITYIVDRLGSGDAFTGGLIYGLNHYGSDMQSTLDFAMAAACLKHGVFGDFCLITRDEVEALIGGSKSGWINR